MPDPETNVRNIVNGQMSASLTPPVAQYPAQGPGSSNAGREEEGKKEKKEEKGGREGRESGGREAGRLLNRCRQGW